MTRYADPTRCPDCRAALPPMPEQCPDCALPLTGPLVRELFRTLGYADALVLRLRATAVPAPALPTPADPRPVAPRRGGLRTASVPTILLGLGALCLLVAAITFLVMAWALMGIGGRTLVLVGLTATAGVLGTWLARRGLRVAAESLVTVALGMLVLDVLGAVGAGWVGDPGADGTLVLVGAVVATASGFLLAASERLAVPQVALPLGVVSALCGVGMHTTHDVLLASMAVVVLGATTWVGRLVSAPVLVWVAGTVAGLWWLRLVGLGLVGAIEEPTVPALWVDGNGLGLLAATALALTPIAIGPPSRSVGLACASLSATLLTVTVAFPVVDGTTTQLGVVALVAMLAWTAVAAVLPTRWSVVAAFPIGAASLPAVGIVAGLATDALGRIVEVGAPFTRAPDVLLAGPVPIADPLLVPPLAGALVLAAWVLADRPRGRTWTCLAGATVMTAGLVTVASYDVPLGVVTGILAVVAIGLVVPASRATVGATGAALAAAAVAAVSTGFALPSDWLTATSAAATALVGSALLTARSARARLVGEALLPVAAGGLVWCVGALADVDIAARGLPVLVVVGALALARPRMLLEASAGLCALVAASASVGHAADQPTSLALHLTVAGVLVTASSLLHADRRELGWLGGFLLAAATWVRLYDLGVDAPEAYTLPSAVALLAFGLHRLGRVPGASSEVLVPGLALATVPSLLWVLAVDPLTPRALLLGLACLALVMVGTRLGWGAPIVVGAVVGGLVVLRELAPYAEATPRWVLIGLAGTVLTVVGVTWEQRVHELRRTTAYLGRMR